MDENTHVYCTKCLHGAILLCDIIFSHNVTGPCKTCDPYDPEDSRPFKERPNYVPEIKQSEATK